MRINVWTRLVGVLAAGSGLALGLPAFSGVSQAAPNATVTVGNATLADRGAVIFVPVTFTCPVGEQLTMAGITVTEAVGNAITQGGGGFPGGQCTGTPQSATVTIVATTRPFRRGSAFAQANLGACQPPFNVICDGASDARSIRIK